MNKRIVLAAALLCAAAFAASGLPSTFLDSSSTDGFLGAGVMIGYDFGHRSVCLEIELFYGMTNRFGVGLTWVTDVPKLTLGSFSLDGLYWLDPDSSGYGAIVVPVKVRLAMSVSPENEFLFGAGLAAGLQDYAFAVYSTGDLFLSVKALAEIDFWSSGHVDPLVMAGGTFEGTTGTPSGSSYVIYYYY